MLYMYVERSSSHTMSCQPNYIMSIILFHFVKMFITLIHIPT